MTQTDALTRAIDYLDAEIIGYHLSDGRYCRTE
jgi:hypothetical protein